MSAWFDYTVYMNNKVANLQKTDKAGDWTLQKVMQAFADAGFGDATGAEQHFMQFGQYEDVAPNAFFSPTEYYRAKAVEFTGKKPAEIGEMDVINVQMAIKGLGMGAWSHYKAFGSAEGVNPSNQFDTEAYINAKVAALNAVLADGQTKYTPESVVAAFKAMNITALEHFMTFGGDATKGEVPFKYNGTIPSEFAVPLEKQVQSDNANDGYTFGLTADTDIINTTTNTTGKPTATTFAGALDDTFVAGVAGGSASLNAGDNLDGAGGHNTLRIIGEAAGSANLGSVTLANIQTVELTGTLTTGAPIDVSAHKGVVKDLIIKNITAAASSGAAFTADISQTVTLMGTHTFSAGSGDAIVYKGLSTTGADDSALLKLNGLSLTDGASSNGATLTVNGVENLTLNLTGTNDFGTLSDTGLKNLTLTGPGTAKGTVTASSGTTISSINAATSGGADLSIDTAKMNATDGFTYTGSKNTDKLAITTASNTNKMVVDLGDGDNQLAYVVHASGIASGSSFKAGAGTNDKLVLSASAVGNVTSTVANAFSGFETLSTALDTLDVSMFKGITSVEIAGNAGVIGLNAEQAKDILVKFGSTSGSVGVASKTFALKDATGTNDSIGFTLEHALGGANVANLTGATLTGFENLTVQAKSGAKEIQVSGQTAGTNYAQVTLAAAADLKTVTLAGDYALQFNMSGATKITEINASTNTAGVDLLVGGQTGALKVTGTAKADHIAIAAAGANGSLTLDAGDGNDIVSGALVDIKASVLNGGAGNDVLIFTDSATSTTATWALNDTDLKGVSDFSELQISSAHVGTTNIVLGAYASDLAATNNGILKITATALAANASADTITFDSSAMRTTAAVDLSLKNTGTGNVTVTTGDGNDIIKVELAGTPTGAELSINGGKGDDTITVTAASAYASTSAIDGGAGNDTINGSGVVDIIIGGAGADIMTGGAGDDLFTYNAVGQSNGSSIDWIKDFTAGGSDDKIQLKAGASAVLKGVSLVSGTSASVVAIKADITLTSAADLADLQTQLTDAVTANYTGSLGGASNVNAANGLQVGLIKVTGGALADKVYMFLNDSTAGFQAADDMLIDVTGINGALAAGDFAFIA